MIRTFALASLVAATSFTLASYARADDPPMRLAVAEAARPLTLPSMVVNPRLDLYVLHYQAGGTWTNLDAAASLGLTDDFGVHAVVAPLQLAGPAGNGFQFGQTTQDRGPSLGATYRFVRGTVEAALALDGRVFTVSKYQGGAIIPAAYLRVHAGASARIDAGVSLNITRATEKLSTDAVVAAGVVATPPIASVTANAVRLDVPVSALYNLSEPVYVQVTSGLTIYDLSDTRNSTGIPLGAYAGYAVAGKEGPVLDVSAGFTFPYLIMPGAASVTNTLVVIGLNVGGYVYL